MTTLNAVQTAEFFSQRTRSQNANGGYNFGLTGDWFWNFFYENNGAGYNTKTATYEQNEALADEGLLNGTDNQDHELPITQQLNHPRPHGRPPSN